MSSEKRLRKPRRRRDDERQRQEDELQVFWDGHGDGPEGVAVDDEGNIYITVTGAILKLSPTGEVLAEWGSAGDKLGRFKEATFIALDATGSVFVTEPDKQRLQKISPDGELLEHWQTRRVLETPQTLPFWTPAGVAVAPSGHVYVSDPGNCRIVRLTSECKLLNYWGAEGDSPGEFDQGHLRGIAVDGDGNVWIVNSLDDRIQKFSPTGEPLASWGCYGRGPGQFEAPNDIALDLDGNIYVVEGEDNNRIQKFSPAGEPLVQWGATEWGKRFDGPLMNPHSLAVDAEGSLFITNDDPDLVIKLPPLREPLGQDNEYWLPVAVAVDALGNLHVADQHSHRLVTFSAEGERLAAIGSYGRRPGQFAYPAAIALDNDGNLYVADEHNYRIQKLSPEGLPVAQWPVPKSQPDRYTQPTGSRRDLYTQPTGVALSREGEVFVEYSYGILKLSAVGAVVSEWPWPEWKLSRLTGDTAGNIYACQQLEDDHGRRVRVLRLWPGEMQTVVELPRDSSLLGEHYSYYLSDYVVASASGVYLANRSSRQEHRVHQISLDGTVAPFGPAVERHGGIYPWGAAVDVQGLIRVFPWADPRAAKLVSGELAVPPPPQGGRTGEFYCPVGITLDRVGNVYVANGFCRRIDKLSPEGEMLAQWGVSGRIY